MAHLSLDRDTAIQAREGREGCRQMQSTIGSEDDERAALPPFLTILSVIAISVAAVVGLGGPPDLSPPEREPASVAGATIEIRPATPSRLLIFIVGSAERKRALEQEISSDPEWFIETYAEAGTRVRVVALDPAQEVTIENLPQLIPEASITTGLGPEFRIVDMR
jgi:hypothetical protein